jgi:hypothetical protein
VNDHSFVTFLVRTPENVLMMMMMMIDEILGTVPPTKRETIIYTN